MEAGGPALSRGTEELSMRLSRSSARPLAAAAALLLAVPAADLAAQQVDRPLSLREAIALAFENNPDYLSQESQLRSAEWNLRASYGNLLPNVNASSSVGYTATGERRLDSVMLGEQPAMYSSRYSLGMSLSVNGNSLLAPTVARAQSRAVEETVDGAAANLAAEVTQRYLSVLEARDAVEQAERELVRTSEYVRLAEARFEVGAGTQLDVRRSEVQRGQAEVRLVQARNAAANEVLALGQVIGGRLPQDVQLSERFDLFEPAWRADELVAAALADNPSLRASRAQADAAATRARAAASAYLPTLSFNAGLSGFVSQAGDTAPLIAQEMLRAQTSYQQCIQQNELRAAVGLGAGQCTDPSLASVQQGIRERVEAQHRGFPFDYVRQPASASLTVSVPVFTGFSRQQQVEDARISRLNAQHQVRAQELRVEVDVETALRNLETSYRSALLQSQIRETAAEELRLAEERFRFGAGTSVEVVDAQASLAEAERAEIAAVYNFHRSLAVLEARIGQPLGR
jgi:outer membrane protein